MSNLVRFADWLAPNTDEGKAISEEIRKCMAGLSSLDRFYVAGSAGKGTALRCHLDFDCVFLLNVSKSPLEDKEEDIRSKYEYAKMNFFKARVLIQMYNS